MMSDQHPHVVAIMRSEATGLQLDRECQGMNGTRVEAHVGALKDVKPDIDFLRSLDILLLELDPRIEEDFEELEAVVKKRFPGTPVISTAAEATVQDVRRLMRMGVVDFLPQPFSHADIDASINVALDRKRAVLQEPEDKGRIISILKGGGGVGATTLAVQAGCVQATRWRKEGKSAALVDFDLQGGTAALYLDLDNRVGVSDLLDAVDRLDSSLLEGVVTKHESGLNLIPGPRDVIPLDTLTPEAVLRIADLCRNQFDLTIFDLPPAWGDGMHTALECSDAILLVSELSVTGVRQAKHQLDTIAIQGLGDVPVKVVLNRYEKKWGRSVQLGEAEKALGHRVDYQIPNDYRLVSEAINQGVALSRLKGRTKVEKAITGLLDAVLGEMSAREADPANSQTPRMAIRSN